MATLVFTSGCMSSQQVRRADESRLVGELAEPKKLISNGAEVERININVASAQQLERIPHIGSVMARRIVEHRERFGPFRRPEHLIITDGMSDIRFRRIRHLITAE
ncbi:MAG TPA: helix-hairpin-helix domain-containing protein [Pyrinomonadaceae bacterium]|nr:helix-hairpin-helix domain-containing protein [Pyrinomonadaceae bacterium]